MEETVSYEHIRSVTLGFEMDYAVYDLRSGDGLGPRIVYVSSDQVIWENVGSFQYDYYDNVHIRIDFSKPMDFQAFSVPRQYPDASSFNVSQILTAIWVADYDYVELA